MKVERLDGRRERRILTGMVVDRSVLAEVAVKWDDHEGLFQSSWCNLVGGWCVEYYNRYGKAPGKAVEGLYEVWSESVDDKATSELVRTFLSQLSGEYTKLRKENNPKQLVDDASEQFNRVRLARLVEKLQADLDSGKVKRAKDRVEAFDHIELGVGAGIDVLSDHNLVKRIFDRQSDPLVTYSGSLGAFFGSSLERDGFVAFMGREKIGKSWWLLDVAWRAMLARRRVAFFEVGDLSEEQAGERFLTRAACRPVTADEWPCTLKLPRQISRPDVEPTVEFEERTWKEPMTEAAAIAAFQKVRDTRLKSDREYLRMSSHPARTLSVAGSKSVMNSWKRRDGWVPDVVVYDYADILAHPPGYKGEQRDAVNETWIQLRALSSELHCLVLTATQANATAYKNNRLDMTSYSEDKRKFSHVTGMVGLSQSDTEKESGITVLNWLVRRSRQHFVKRYLFAAGCLGIGNPAMASTF